MPTSKLLTTFQWPLIGIFVPLLFVIIGGNNPFQIVSQLWWQRVDAKVTACEVTSAIATSTTAQSRNNPKDIKWTYEYVINGLVYQGQRFGSIKNLSLIGKEADKINSRFLSGDPLVVPAFYDRSDPTKSYAEWVVPHNRDLKALIYTCIGISTMSMVISLYLVLKIIVVVCFFNK